MYKHVKSTVITQIRSYKVTCTVRFQLSISCDSDFTVITTNDFSLRVICILAYFKNAFWKKNIIIIFFDIMNLEVV